MYTSHSLLYHIRISFYHGNLSCGFKKGYYSDHIMYFKPEQKLSMFELAILLFSQLI